MATEYRIRKSEPDGSETDWSYLLVITYLLHQIGYSKTTPTKHSYCFCTPF